LKKGGIINNEKLQNAIDDLREIEGIYSESEYNSGLHSLDIKFYSKSESRKKLSTILTSFKDFDFSFFGAHRLDLSHSINILSLSRNSSSRLYVELFINLFAYALRDNIRNNHNNYTIETQIIVNGVTEEFSKSMTYIINNYWKLGFVVGYVADTEKALPKGVLGVGQTYSVK